MSTHIVTCMYNDLHETEFTGRASRKPFYYCSLKNLLNLNTPIHLYTSSNEVESINGLNSELIDIQVGSLNQLPIYNRIKDLKIKLAGSLEVQRCYEIMYSKTYWLRKTIENTNGEFYYWMDVGLSHNGLFPKKLKRKPDSDDYCDKYFNYNVFNNSMMSHINKLSNNALYCMCFDQSKKPWQSYIDEKYITSLPRKKLHMIGGLFGGRKEMVIKFCDEFERRLDIILNDGVLYNEEVIYTSIVNDNESMFNPQYFNSWYHVDSDLYQSWTKGLHTVKEFYKLFVHER